jgi:hypothetical protein
MVFTDPFGFRYQRLTVYRDRIYRLTFASYTGCGWMEVEITFLSLFGLFWPFKLLTTHYKVFIYTNFNASSLVSYFLTFHYKKALNSKWIKPNITTVTTLFFIYDYLTAPSIIYFLGRCYSDKWIINLKE